MQIFNAPYNSQYAKFLPDSGHETPAGKPHTAAYTKREGKRKKTQKKKQ